MTNEPTGNDIAHATCPVCGRHVYLSKEEFAAIQADEPEIKRPEQVRLMSKDCGTVLIFRTMQWA